MDRSVDFVDYVYSFYGPRGLYPIKPTITRQDILSATKTLLAQPNITVEYDSIDRERVRDIMLDEIARTQAIVSAWEDMVTVNDIGCEFDRP